MNEVAADTPPPPTKPTPIIPQLPPIKTTDKKEEVTEITDQTLLKDIIIKSRCLGGECSTSFTCKILSCSDKDLIIFTDTSQNDEQILCEGNDKAKVLDDKILKCGFLWGDEFNENTAKIELTSEVLNQGICANYSYENSDSIANDGLKGKKCHPDTVIYGYFTSTRSIELTFSLSPIN